MYQKSVLHVIIKSSLTSKDLEACEPSAICNHGQSSRAETFLRLLMFDLRAPGKRMRPQCRYVEEYRMSGNLFSLEIIKCIKCRKFPDREVLLIRC